MVPGISWYVPVRGDFRLFAHTNWLVHWYTGTVPDWYRVQQAYCLSHDRFSPPLQRVTRAYVSPHVAKTCQNLYNAKAVKRDIA